MGGLRPRGPVDIAGPRPPAGLVLRPVNFTVRSHLPIAMTLSTPLVPYCIGALLVISAAGGAYTQYGRNARVKRILWTVTMVSTAALFLLLFSLVPRPKGGGDDFWFVIPIIVISLFLTYRSVKFCSHCGATSRGTTFRPVRFCSSCGAELGK